LFWGKAFIDQAGELKIIGRLLVMVFGLANQLVGLIN
jgi:hypothetical protein